MHANAPNYQLRAADISDLPDMMAIGHEGIRPYVEALGVWDPVEQATGFRVHFTPADIWIVQMGRVDTGELANAGYFKLVAYAEHLFLEGIYLSVRHRGSGVGSAIIRELMEQARREDKPLRLRVLRPNPARLLYERLGFRCIDETARALLMECDPRSG